MNGAQTDKDLLYAKPKLQPSATIQALMDAAPGIKLFAMLGRPLLCKGLQSVRSGYTVSETGRSCMLVRTGVHIRMILTSMKGCVTEALFCIMLTQSFT